MKHCYIDTETTGLNPAKHEIIEIAIITENEDGTFERWHTKIKPDHIENAHPKALEVNGYTPEAWEGAPNFEDVVPEITSRLKGSIWLVTTSTSTFDSSRLCWTKPTVSWKSPTEERLIRLRWLGNTCYLQDSLLRPLIRLGDGWAGP